MYNPPANIEALFFQAEEENLYEKLILQLQKDFHLANEDLDVETTMLPIELKQMVHEKIYYLIQHKFAEYLNLLYIIDVPENEVKKLDGSDLVELSERVAFLVLKREWQKVWFRNRF